MTAPPQLQLRGLREKWPPSPWRPLPSFFVLAYLPSCSPAVESLHTPLHQVWHHLLLVLRPRRPPPPQQRATPPSYPPRFPARPLGRLPPVPQRLPPTTLPHPHPLHPPLPPAPLVPVPPFLAPLPLPLPPRRRRQHRPMHLTLSLAHIRHRSKTHLRLPLGLRHPSDPQAKASSKSSQVHSVGTKQRKLLNSQPQAMFGCIEVPTAAGARSPPVKGPRAGANLASATFHQCRSLLDTTVTRHSVPPLRKLTASHRSTSPPQNAAI
mmetsp:Transcript_24851/g.57321  ORF Transcript_24851/g.57321 Transcript_24851/m.57321 type:complete len:266 (+) Transcript_24851:666-1463(+)